MTKIIQKSAAMSSYTEEQACAMSAIQLLAGQDLVWESAPFEEKFANVDGRTYRVGSNGEVVVQTAG